MTDAHTILIAGASRGLGLGLARQFAERGWQVVGTVRDAAAAPVVPGVMTELLDTTDPDSLAALHDRLSGHAFDILMVSAGMRGPQHQDPMQVTEAEVGHLFMTNAIAPVRMARSFADLVKPNGVIALMTSGLGSVALNDDGGSELYRASKAALNSLTRSLTASLDGRDLTILAMHPGWVRTDMGGSAAPLDVETSTRGIADVLIGRLGSGQHGFVDYSDKTLPW